MSLAETVRRTENYLRAETKAQEVLLGLLEAQERAVRSGRTSEILSANARYEETLRKGSTRDAERSRLLAEFGAFYGVAPKALSLASIIERLGPHAGQLPAERVRLRAATSRVLQASRRLSSIARYHGSIVEEVLGLLQPEDANPSDGRGSLVHVEA